MTHAPRVNDLEDLWHHIVVIYVTDHVLESRHGDAQVRVHRTMLGRGTSASLRTKERR
jgi:hypothetical protein